MYHWGEETWPHHPSPLRYLYQLHSQCQPWESPGHHFFPRFRPRHYTLIINLQIRAMPGQGGSIWPESQLIPRIFLRIDYTQVIRVKIMRKWK